LLILSAKKPPVTLPPVVAEHESPPRRDNEQDIIRIAFGVLQTRVTEQITARYPEARWIWNVPNAIERLATGLPLTIALNRAGGFKTAAIQVHNMQFRGIIYHSAATPEEPPFDSNEVDNSVPDNVTSAEPETTDYSALAFEWVESNLLRLNELCNTAIAANDLTMLIAADTLPNRDSWTDICSELTRNGFNEAIALVNGIQVTLPQNS
jgi:hypothetical protein